MNERLIVYLLADANQYFGVLTSARTRLIAFAAATSAELTAHSFKLASNYENNLIGFTTMAKSAADQYSGVMSTVMGQIQAGDTALGDMTRKYAIGADAAQQKGQKLVDQITQLAVVTPYMTDELIQAGRTLAGYGVEIDNVLPTLSAIGEVTAGVGGDLEKLQRITLAYGQVVSKGRFYAAELRQFTEAGVGAKDFADTMGVSVKQFSALMEDGKVSSDVMVRGFQKMTQEGGKFHGLMDKLMRSPLGRWNTFWETVQIGLRDLGRIGLGSIEKSGFWNEINRISMDMRGHWDHVANRVERFFGHAREGLLGVEAFTKAILDMANRTGDEFEMIDFTFQDAVVWAAKIPYEGERFGLKIMQGLTSVGQYWDTKIVPPMRGAARDFIYIITQGWDVFANTINAANKMAGGDGKVLGLTQAELKYRAKVAEDKANDEKAAAFWKGRQEHFSNRILETDKKIAEQGQKLRKAFDEIPSWMGPSGPKIPPLTIQEKLLGSMTDYISEVRSAMGGGKGSGFGNAITSVSNLAEKIAALRKASDPIGVTWEESFAKLQKGIADADKALRNSAFGPKPGMLQYNQNPEMALMGGAGMFLDLEHALKGNPAVLQMMDQKNRNWMRKIELDKRSGLLPGTSLPRGPIENVMGALGGGMFEPTMNRKIWGELDQPGSENSPGPWSKFFSDFSNEAMQGAMGRQSAFFGASTFNGIAESIRDAVDPFLLAMNNSDFVDSKGNVGITKIVKALGIMDPTKQAAAVREMFKSGDIKYTGTNLNPKEAAFGAGSLYDNLVKAVGIDQAARDAGRRPIFKGSQEEADMVARFRAGDQRLSLEDEVRNLIQALEERSKKTEERDKELLDIFRGLQKNGTLKIVTISGGNG